LASYSAANFTPSVSTPTSVRRERFTIPGMMDNAWPGGFGLLALCVAGRVVAPKPKALAIKGGLLRLLNFGFIQAELPHRLLDKFGLRFRNLILSHEHSDLMFDDDRRRRFYFSSKPVRAH
jgi:hypothetical protein